MAQANLSQIVYTACRDLGCLRAGQVPSPDVINDCLLPANDILEVWAVDSTMIFTYAREVWTLVAGKQNYTVGPDPSADIQTTRPTGIERANVILDTPQTLFRPVEIVNMYEWAAIRLRVLPFAIPMKLYYERDYSALGLGAMHLWPGPQINYGLEVYSWNQLTAFPDVTTVYQFPPAYLYCFRKTLAVEIAPMLALRAKTDRLERPKPAMVELVARQAEQALEKIKSYNVGNIPPLQCDPMYLGAMGGAFNYMLGEENPPN